MKLLRKQGSTSNIEHIFIQDTTSPSGAGLAGLLFNSPNLVAAYHRDTDGAGFTAIPLVTMTVGVFTSGGFKEVDNTRPGWYQFCPPDAAFAAGKSVAINIMGATNMQQLPIEVQLTGPDWDDAVAMGLTGVGITSNIKKNQALANFAFLMTDNVNHAPVTGKVVTCTRSIDNGAFGAGTLANVAEIAFGVYKVDFGAADLNGKVIMLRCTAAGSDDTFERIVTQS